MNITAPKFKWRAAIACASVCATTFASLAFGQNGRAVSAVEVTQAIERVRISATDDVMADALVIGGALLKSGRFSEAVELFSALAEKKSNDPNIVWPGTGDF